MRSAVASRSHLRDGAEHVDHEAPRRRCWCPVTRRRCGSAVQLGNQHGADLAAVYGAHDPLPPWPVEILSGGARVNYHVDQLVIVQRGQRFQLHLVGSFGA